jgi:hypothetical protein
MLAESDSLGSLASRIESRPSAWDHEASTQKLDRPAPACVVGVSWHLPAALATFELPVTGNVLGAWRTDFAICHISTLKITVRPHLEC